MRHRKLESVIAISFEESIGDEILYMHKKKYISLTVSGRVARYFVLTYSSLTDLNNRWLFERILWYVFSFVDIFL